MKSYPSPSEQNYGAESGISDTCLPDPYVLVNSEQLEAWLQRSVAPDAGSLPSHQLPLWQRLKLEQVWDTLLKWAMGSTEPHIVRRVDRQGTVYFRVYDPVSKRAYLFGSEQEVRSWLDQRYYE